MSLEIDGVDMIDICHIVHGPPTLAPPTDPLDEDPAHPLVVHLFVRLVIGIALDRLVTKEEEDIDLVLALPPRQNAPAPETNEPLQVGHTMRRGNPRWICLVLYLKTKEMLLNVHNSLRNIIM